MRSRESHRTELTDDDRDLMRDALHVAPLLTTIVFIVTRIVRLVRFITPAVVGVTVLVGGVALQDGVYGALVGDGTPVTLMIFTIGAALPAFGAVLITAECIQGGDRD